MSTVAKIGSTEFESLQDAFTAAQAGDKIELVSDIQAQATISVDKQVTLDIQGYSITAADAKTSIFSVKDGADFTITGTADGKLLGVDLYNCESYNTDRNVINCAYGSKLTVENVSIIGGNAVNTKYAQTAIYCNCWGKEDFTKTSVNLVNATVKGGDVVVTDLDEEETRYCAYQGVAGKGVYCYYATLNIKDSTVTGGSSDLTDYTGEISGKYFAQTDGATAIESVAILTIDGSTITGGDGYDEDAYGIKQGSYNNATPEAAVTKITNSTITGGNAVLDASDAVYLYTGNNATIIGSTLTGGKTNCDWQSDEVTNKYYDGNGLYISSKNSSYSSAADITIQDSSISGRIAVFGNAAYDAYGNMNVNFVGNNTLSGINASSWSPNNDSIVHLTGWTKELFTLNLDGVLMVENGLFGVNESTVFYIDSASYEEGSTQKIIDVNKDNTSVGENVSVVALGSDAPLCSTRIDDDGDVELTVAKAVATIAKENVTYKYASLADAFAAAKAGDTVKLLVSEITNLSNIPAGVTVEGSDDKTLVNVTDTMTGSFTGVTLRNLKFVSEGSAWRWGYGYGDKIVIDNCEFNGQGQYGLHFDELHADLEVTNSTIYGTVAISATTKEIKFDGVAFAGRSGTGHCNINFYSSATLNGCTFTDDYATGSKRGILQCAEGMVVELNNCSMAEGSQCSLTDVFRRDYLQLGVIDGVKNEDGKYTAGTFVAGSVAKLAAYADADLIAGLPVTADNFTGKLVFDSVKKTVALEGGKLTGDLKVKDGWTLSMDAEVTLAEGVKVTLDNTECLSGKCTALKDAVIYINDKVEDLAAWKDDHGLEGTTVSALAGDTVEATFTEGEGFVINLDKDETIISDVKSAGEQKGNIIINSNTDKGSEVRSDVTQTADNFGIQIKNSISETIKGGTMKITGTIKAASNTVTITNGNEGTASGDDEAVLQGVDGKTGVVVEAKEIELVNYGHAVVDFKAETIDITNNSSQTLIGEVNGTYTTIAGDGEIKDATVTGYKTLTVTGTQTLVNSTLSAGTFTNASGSTITMDGSSTIEYSSSFKNSGTIIVDLADDEDLLMYKLVDYTGSSKSITKGNFTVVDEGYSVTTKNGDILVWNKSKIDYSTIVFVNDGKEYSYGDAVVVGDTTYYYGENAFTAAYEMSYGQLNSKATKVIYHDTEALEAVAGRADALGVQSRELVIGGTANRFADGAIQLSTDISGTATKVSFEYGTDLTLKEISVADGAKATLEIKGGEDEDDRIRLYIDKLSNQGTNAVITIENADVTVNNYQVYGQNNDIGTGAKATFKNLELTDGSVLKIWYGGTVTAETLKVNQGASLQFGLGDEENPSAIIAGTGMLVNNGDVVFNGISKMEAVLAGTGTLKLVNAVVRGTITDDVELGNNNLELNGAQNTIEGYVATKGSIDIGQLDGGANLTVVGTLKTFGGSFTLGWENSTSRHQLRVTSEEVAEDVWSSGVVGSEVGGFYILDNAVLTLENGGGVIYYDTFSNKGDVYISIEDTDNPVSYLLIQDFGTNTKTAKDYTDGNGNWYIEKPDDFDIIVSNAGGTVMNDLYAVKIDYSTLVVDRAFAGYADGYRYVDAKTGKEYFIGYNLFGDEQAALAKANEKISGYDSITIDVQDGAKTTSSGQIEFNFENPGTYKITGGSGFLFNEEIELNNGGNDGEYNLDIYDADVTMRKVTLRKNANLTITDSTIAFEAFQNGSSYLSIYNNSTLTITNSTVGSKASDYTGEPNFFGPRFTIGGTATVTDSTIYTSVGQGGDGIDMLGDGSLTVTNSAIHMAFVNLGNTFNAKYSEAGDESTAVITLDNSTMDNTQYAGDQTYKRAANIILGMADGTRKGKLVLKNNSTVDLTGANANQFKDILVNTGSAIDVADSTLKARNITNSGAVGVSGTSTLSAESYAGNLNVGKAGTATTLTTTGLTMTSGNMLIADGSEVTLSGDGFDLGPAYIQGEKGAYNDVEHTGYTLNIKDAKAFKVHAIYANTGSTVNVSNVADLDTMYLNVYGGALNLDNSTAVDETTNVTGTLSLNNNAVLNSDIFNIYNGREGKLGGTVNVTGATINVVSNFGMKIGVETRDYDKYYANGNDQTAKLNLSGSTVTVDYTLTNAGAITMDCTSTIKANTFSGDNGTITVDMIDAKQEGGIYHLIDTLKESKSEEHFGSVKFTGTETFTGSSTYRIYQVDGDLWATNLSLDTIGVSADLIDDQGKEKDFGTEVELSSNTYYYRINAFASMKDAESAIELAGGTTTIVVGGTKAISSESAFGGGDDVTITGTASFNWNTWMMIGRDADHGDVSKLAKVTFSGATITGASYGSGDASIHISGAEKDSATKGNGQLNVTDASNIETAWVVNRYELNVNKGSTFTARQALIVHGRPASETQDAQDATAYMNVDAATVNAYGSSNDSGLVIGNEGKGEINLTNGAVLNASKINATAKSTIIANSSTINVGGTLTNPGAFDNEGIIALTSSTVNAGTINLSDGSTITMDVLSLIKANTLTQAEGAVIKLDADSLVDKAVYKIIDTNDGNIVSVTWTNDDESKAKGYYLVNDGNDVVATNASQEYILVNSDWSTGYQLGDEVKVGEDIYYYGINAFSDLPKAYDMSKDAETRSGGKQIYINGGTVAYDNSLIGGTAQFTGKTVTVQDGATLQLSADASFSGDNKALVVEAGGTISSDSKDFTFAAGTGTNSFTLKGTADKKAVVDLGTSGHFTANTGTLDADYSDIKTGWLELKDTVANINNSDVAVDRWINVDGSSSLKVSGSTITTNGLVNVASVELKDSKLNVGETNIVAGVQNYASFKLIGSTITGTTLKNQSQNGSKPELDIDKTSFVNVTTITNAAGSITNSGTITANSVTNSSSFTNSGTISVQSVANEDEFYNTGTFTAGILTNNNKFEVSGNASLTAKTLTNNEDFAVGGSASLTVSDNLNNFGSMTIDSTASVKDFSNNGTLVVKANADLTIDSFKVGTVELTNGGTISVASLTAVSGTITVSTGTEGGTFTAAKILTYTGATERNLDYFNGITVNKDYQKYYVTTEGTHGELWISNATLETVYVNSVWAGSSTFQVVDTDLGAIYEFNAYDSFVNAKTSYDINGKSGEVKKISIVGGTHVVAGTASNADFVIEAKTITVGDTAELKLKEGVTNILSGSTSTIIVNAGATLSDASNAPLQVKDGAELVLSGSTSGKAKLAFNNAELSIADTGKLTADYADMNLVSLNNEGTVSMGKNSQLTLTDLTNSTNAVLEIAANTSTASVAFSGNYTNGGTIKFNGYTSYDRFYKVIDNQTESAVNYGTVVVDGSDSFVSIVKENDLYIGDKKNCETIVINGTYSATPVIGTEVKVNSEFYNYGFNYFTSFADTANDDYDAYSLLQSGTAKTVLLESESTTLTNNLYFGKNTTFKSDMGGLTRTLSFSGSTVTLAAAAQNSVKLTFSKDVKLDASTLSQLEIGAADKATTEVTLNNTLDAYYLEIQNAKLNANAKITGTYTNVFNATFNLDSAFNATAVGIYSGIVDIDAGTATGSGTSVWNVNGATASIKDYLGLNYGYDKNFGKFGSATLNATDAVLNAGTAMAMGNDSYVNLVGSTMTTDSITFYAFESGEAKGCITVDADSLLSVDTISGDGELSLTYSGNTNWATLQYTGNLSGFSLSFEGLDDITSEAKLIDYTGTEGNGLNLDQYKTLLGENWIEGKFVVEDGDLYYTLQNNSVVYVNSTYSKDTTDGWGKTRFATVEAAIAAKPSAIEVTGGTLTHKGNNWTVGFSGYTSTIDAGVNLGLGAYLYGGNAEHNGTTSGACSLTINQTVGSIYALFGGDFIDAYKTIVDETGNINLVVNAGDYRNRVAGGDRIQNGVFQRTGDINFTINGGYFLTFVYGGLMINKDKYGVDSSDLDMAVLVGNIEMKITGGTFNNAIYAGNGAYSAKGDDEQKDKDTLNRSNYTAITGGVNLTIDASSQKIIFNSDIFVASKGHGQIYGNATVTIKGQGSNLSFNHKLQGGSDYTVRTTSDSGVSTYQNYIQGQTILNFEGFTGSFDGTIKVMYEMNVDAASTVNFTNDKLDLSDVRNWNLEIGGSLSGIKANNFKGDTMKLDLAAYTEGEVNVLSGAASSFSTWAGNDGKDVTVYFGEQKAVYSNNMYTAGNYKLWLSDTDENGNKTLKFGTIA